MSIHRLWQSTCQITTAWWVWKKVVLAFKGQAKQWSSSSFAEQHRVLYSKHELANLLIPSYSCHKQVLHEYRPETIHVFTILNEIFIRLSSWPFLWHWKRENSCICKVIKFTFGNGAWTQPTAPRLRPEGISTVQRWNMQRQKYKKHGDIANCVSIIGLIKIAWGGRDACKMIRFGTIMLHTPFAQV